MQCMKTVQKKKNTYIITIISVSRISHIFLYLFLNCTPDLVFVRL